MNPRIKSFVRDMAGLGAVMDAIDPPAAASDEIEMREIAPGVFAQRAPRPPRERRIVRELNTLASTAERVSDGLTTLQRTALELGKKRRRENRGRQWP